MLVEKKAIVGFFLRHLMFDQSECLSEESDLYTAYNSPASSGIDDYNVAAEVEM